MKKLTLILSLLFVFASCNNEALEHLQAEDSSNLNDESSYRYLNSHIYYKNIHYIKLHGGGNWINYTKDSFEFEEMMRKQVNSNLFENHSSLSLITDSVVTMMPLQK